MKKKFDVLIRDGLIFDGTSFDPFVADIGICGKRIAFVGPPGTNDAELLVEAKGLAVSPGFIDTHSHSDFTILADSRAEGKLVQGITTEINGNCGMSAAPLFGKVFEKREDDLKELGVRERWNTLGEYFAILEKKGSGVNMAMLAGHGNIRGCIAGYDDRHLSPVEMSGMADLLKNTLDQGAIGFSTGLIYPPGIYSTTEEIIDLASKLCDADLIYTSHMRSEGTALLEAVKEVIRIGREAGGKVHISHIKTAGEQNWHKADKVISLLEDTRKTGVRITCDRYPYTASSTDLDSILPSWAFAGGNEEELRRLNDPLEKRRIMKDMWARVTSAGYWEKIIVSSVASEKNTWMEGKTIGEISNSLQMEKFDAVFKILIDEKLRVGAIFLSMSDENLRKFLALPFCMIGSDSSARCFDGPTKKGKPHPRSFGTFPRLFGKFVRDEKLLSLPRAIHKATMLAALTFGLKDRGGIKENMFADIVVFDPWKIGDRATFDNPFQKPEGIYHVFVNGAPAILEGRLTGKVMGMVLKKEIN
jgi:N-acyl-D-amino-acid deacylase